MVEDEHATIASGGTDDRGPLERTHRINGRASLAPWQVGHAKALMLEGLRRGLILAEVAEALGISANHLVKAFANSTGIAPYHWFVRQRVATALTQLVDAHVPLATVAAHCGFADQSHFTRVFRRIVGQTPGQWRRAMPDDAEGRCALMRDTSARIGGEIACGNPQGPPAMHW